MDILDHIRDEKEALKQAPLAFVLLTLLAFIAAVLGVDWLHADRFAASKQEVDTVKQQNELLSTRIQGKDEQLNDYRSRLISLESKPESRDTKNSAVDKKKEQFSRATTRFSKRSNKELADMAEKLGHEILDLTRSTAKGSYPDAQLTQAVWDYSDKYQADAVVLRDEILSRLPLVDRPNYESFMYEHPTNWQGLQEVANDLRRLGKMLPLN